MGGGRYVTIGGKACGTVIVTGDNNTVNVRSGPTSAPTGFRARIRRLEAHYLGSQDRPVPFGGRGSELEKLDSWLADPNAPPNLLITAPPGRGKTALLVHWLQSIVGGEWAIAFIPISIRFETNRPDVFYQALAVRLAEVLGKEIKEAQGDVVAVYKEKVIEQLDAIPASGKRCLVVLDGLDEATGWRIDTGVLPPDPIPGLRIVASARLMASASEPQEWLLRVGWKAGDTRLLGVPPLDRDGIADVLGKIGVPLASLAGDLDVLGELLRLAEGDPLLLRFYVEDLWYGGSEATGLRPEDLRGREAGFGAYFEDWLTKQGGLYLAQGVAFDEEAIKASLLVLACARGPLRFADLDHLVHRLLDPGRIITTEDLEPAERFLIGESRESGYALGHPKLGEYLREDFFGASETVARARTLFLAWGGDTISALNAEELAPEETPSYLLQYYVQHLEESNAAVEQFSALVDDGWRRAWEARDGSFQGFTNDVRLVWRAIKRELLSGDATASHEAQLVSAGVRCALCMSSVWSLGVNIPASLLQACLHHKIITPRQAIHFADLQDNLHARGRSFTAIAPLLKGEERSQAFDGALTIVGRMTHSTLQKELLTKLISHAGPSIWNRFYEIASTIAQPQDRAQTLASLALYASEDQERARILIDVFGITRSISRPSMAKALLLAGLSINRPGVDNALPRADDLFSDAFAVAQLIRDASSKVEALTQLALSSARFALHEEVVLAAIAAAKASSSPATKAWALARLAWLQAGADQDALRMKDDPMMKDAIAAARTVPNRYQRIVALIAVSSRASGEEREALIKEAFEQANSQYMMEAGVMVAYFLGHEFDDEDKSVIGTYVNANVVRRNYTNSLPCISVNLAANFGVWHAPSRPVDILAPVLPIEAVEEALRLSRYISDVGEQRELLQAILRVLPDDERSEPFAYAWATAMAIADQAGRTRALRELAPFASNEKQEEIFQAAMRIPDNDGRALELGLLAPYIPVASLTRALTAIRSATDPLKRGHALAKLAPRLRGDDGDAALDEAHAAVMGGTGNQQNAQMALEIALGYSEPRRPSALLKTLDWVRQSTSGLTRAMALCQYAPHLDDREERRNVLAEALAFVSTSKDHLAIELLPMIATEFPEQALSVATTLGTPGARADAVASIAPHLSKIQRHAIIPEVMAGLLDVKDALHAAWPLSGFAPYLPETLLPRALTALKDIPDAGERGRAFVTFAQHTDGRHRAECIDGAITAAFEHDADRLAGRAELLAALLPLLSGPKYLRVLSDLTESWFRVSRPMGWRQLGKVVPSLARIGGPAAVRSAFLSVRDVSEWWP